MRYPSNVAFIFFFFLWVAIAAPLLHPTLTVASGENVEEGDYNYIPGSGKGPESWGDLKEEWKTCKIGVEQSPIDINHSIVHHNQSLGMLKIDYKPSHAIMVNRGHDIMIKWPNGGGSLKIDGKTYVLQQLHWHFPSEHTFSDSTHRPPLEMHMVHESVDKKIAVIGIFFYISELPWIPDSFLSPKLMWHLSQLVDEEYVGPLLPPEIEENSPYFRYPGSLTTPPCSEGVIWTLLKKHLPVTIKQLQLLMAAVHYHPNARPIQQLNGRRVSLYKPSHLEYQSS